MNYTNYKNDIINSLSELIAIKSVKAPPALGNPFGDEVSAALDYFLNLGKSLGFEAVNYDNFIGELCVGNELQGESPNEFAILCHLDVVPAGNNWKTHPFSAVISDGKLYGRGAIDNKGPAVITLYAIYSLLAEGKTPKRKIRFILGLDEESGWGCIKHLKAAGSLPREGFSPDADFPAIYAEKGIMHLNFEFDKPKSVISFTGGERANMVCGYAELSFLSENKIKKACYKGKSAHASQPQQGDNAIYHLLKEYKTLHKTLDEIYSVFFCDRLKLKTLCDDSGYLTMSPDIIAVNNGKINLTVDIRYPVSLKHEDILKRFSFLNYTALYHQPPHVTDKNSPLMKSLLNAYSKVTFENSPAVAIGGGTYARALEQGIAFGPVFPYQKSTAHEADEFIPLPDMEKLFNIYRNAVEEICF